MSQRLGNVSRALQKQNRITQLRSSSKINKKQLLDTLIPQKVNKHFDEIYKMIRDNAAIFQHGDIQQLNRAQQRQLGTKQALKIMKTLNINLQQDPYKFIAAMYAISFFGIGQTIKGLVQYLLYIKTLLVFKTNPYHQLCLKRAQRLQDFGSFSLTELHHGSFSRGIGTQAVYDHKNKQFILNTNGEKGMKFWIGNTAQTANKTVVWAQIIVDQVNYGPHTFVMQLRDENTHQVLPGIIIGDCGPKNGLNSIDNGYIMIKDVRIPQKSLLGKLGQIDSNGKYLSKVKTNQQRFGLHMSPLSTGRAVLSFTCLSQSTAALTIALRYACQRRQFKVNENQEQKLIIDYPITRYRLLAPLATNIVTFFAAININILYIENSENFTDPTKRIVSELHAASAVLKAKTSWFTNSVITECRQILGGHGYSSFSGLGRYYSDNDINSTWQGDNNMLLQQTSKYLLKSIKMKQPNSIINMQFVYEGVQGGQIQQKTLNNLQQLKILLQDVFIHRYNTAVRQMSRYRQQFKKGGVKAEDIENQVWNSVQPYYCNQMALSYGDLIYFGSIYKFLANYKGSQHNKQFLTTCLRIWAQQTLLKASIDGFNTRKVLQRLILQGCEAIYPDCIAVTDVIASPSYVMGSPFANQNGEGMKDYLNLLFTAKKTFGRTPWFSRILQMRQSI